MHLTILALSPTLYPQILPVFLVFFAPCGVRKCEIRCQYVEADYIMRLQTLLVYLISDGAAI